MPRTGSRRSPRLIALLVALSLALPVGVVAQERSSGDIEDELAETRSRGARAEQQLEALRSEIGGARTELVEIQQHLGDARGRLRQAEGQVALGEQALAQARERERVAEESLREAQRLLAEAEERLAREEEHLSDQVAASYMYGSANQAALILTVIRQASAPNELVTSMHKLGAILDEQDQVVTDVLELRRERTELRDETRHAREVAATRRGEASDTLAQVRDLRDQAQAVAAEVAADEDRQQQLLASLESDADAQQAILAEAQATSDDLAADLAAAEERERLAAVSDDAQRTASGLVCPVVGAVAGRDFINDWGYPRPDGRRHEGTDIFEERGTPVVAVADATIKEVNRADSGLGGLWVTYHVADGSYWYMAHLDSVAPGIGPGTSVAQGQQVGAVGNSGNARSTPPHTHVGHYYGDGNPVNPYPDLEAAC